VHIPDQLFVFAPLAVNTELSHYILLMDLLLLLMLVMIYRYNHCRCSVNTAVLVPVTVYVVVELGDTVFLLHSNLLTNCMCLPHLRQYDVAPLHIAAGLAVAATGVWITVTLTVAVPVNPSVLVP
jgi:hypothetical protein